MPRRRSAPDGGAEAKRLIAEARKLASSVPITEKEASDKAIAGSFQEVKKDQKVAGRQAEFEQKWDAFATEELRRGQGTGGEGGGAK